MARVCGKTKGSLGKGREHAARHSVIHLWVQREPIGAQGTRRCCYSVISSCCLSCRSGYCISPSYSSVFIYLVLTSSRAQSLPDGMLISIYLAVYHRQGRGILELGQGGHRGQH